MKIGFKKDNIIMILTPLKKVNIQNDVSIICATELIGSICNNIA